jgi:hypothetical protein
MRPLDGDGIGRQPINRQANRHYELRRRNCGLHNSQIGCFVQGARSHANLEEAVDAASTCCSRGEGHPVLLLRGRQHD